MSTADRRYKPLGRIDATGVSLVGNTLHIERQNGVLPDLTVALSALAGTIDVQVFDTPGTYSGVGVGWDKPAGGQITKVRVVGAGAGAGSGARVAGSAIRGGGGGEGGFISERTYLSSDLDDNVDVVVGAGGTGGPGQVSDTTAGVDGGTGGPSSFGGYLKAGGGNKGVGGGSGSGGGGGTTILSNYNFLDYQGLDGGSSSHTGGATNGQDWDHDSSSTDLPFVPLQGPGGGGGGGGLTAADALLGAGDGSSAEKGTGLDFIDTDYLGLGGTSPTGLGNFGGTLGYGGGGGGGQLAGIGAAGTGGANGGFPGGGGGGGSASRNGFVSGKGGDGAGGVVVVITYF